MFLPRTAASPGARILPAVPGIHGDRDQAVSGGGRLRLFDTRAGARFLLVRRCEYPWLGLQLALLQQSQYRVQGFDRIDIQYQTVSVFTDRGKRKNLRLDLALQVEHDAYYTGLEARHAQIRYVRVVRGDLVGETFLHALQTDIFQIEHEALRIADPEQVVLQRLPGFERHARIVLRGPDADRAYGF